VATDKCLTHFDVVSVPTVAHYDPRIQSDERVQASSGFFMTTQVNLVAPEANLHYIPLSH
jgi:hypothetical protein